MELKKMLKKFGIELAQDEQLIDFLHNSKKCYNLDLFPFTINDQKKYKSVEIFYQKFLDGDISKNLFESCEEKYNEFIKTLWLYNEVFVKIQTDIVIEHNYYAKKNILKLKKSRKFINNIISDKNSVNIVNSIEKLQSLLIISTREISPVIWFFPQFEVIIYLSGCSGLLYLNNMTHYDDILKIAIINRLYLIGKQ